MGGGDLSILTTTVFESARTNVWTRLKSKIQIFLGIRLRKILLSTTICKIVHASRGLSKIPKVLRSGIL